MAETVENSPRLKAAPLIVHVVRQFLPNRGGLEDVVANLARQTLKRGYRVRVVTLNSLFTAPDDKLPARETIDGIEVIRIPWSGSSRYPIAPQIFRHIGDAHLIHVHAIDFFFDALAWGRFLHRKPMVVTTHGGFFHTKKFLVLKKVWFRTLTRLSAIAYRRVVCCSASDLSQFVQIVPDGMTIENGADIGKFADAASHTPERRIVTIGRFSVNKRLDLLLDAIAALLKRNPDWHLDIIGAESDLDTADVRREIAARLLEASITLTVSPDNHVIGGIIAKASLMASASEYEGFGIVALEAMSAGLQPVLNSNEAYRSLAGRHEAIILADFTKPEAAADAIEEAYRKVATEGAALRRKLIEAADAYSWDAVAERYIDLYRSIGIAV
ncbi:alpha-1,3-mannosyltransferase [Rhizobium sp. BK650]|nr:alpha-1,3-mannosyltransferase [Rhizobium sp. BK650]